MYAKHNPDVCDHFLGFFLAMAVFIIPRLQALFIRLGGLPDVCLFYYYYYYYYY